MSRPRLAAGAVVVVLLGASLVLGRLGGADSAPRAAATPATSPTAAATPSAAPSAAPSGDGSSASPSVAASGLAPLELDDDAAPPALLLPTGELPADDAIVRAGHEPNGPFWEGVAEWLIRTKLPHLAGRVEFDSEAGLFCAYATDRSALRQLGTAMAEIARSPDRAGALIRAAESAGFTFDD